MRKIIAITPDQAEWMRREAARLGVSETGVIRLLINMAMGSFRPLPPLVGIRCENCPQWQFHPGAGWGFGSGVCQRTGHVETRAGCCTHHPDLQTVGPDDAVGAVSR